MFWMTWPHRWQQAAERLEKLFLFWWRTTVSRFVTEKTLVVPHILNKLILFLISEWMEWCNSVCFFWDIRHLMSRVEKLDLFSHLLVWPIASYFIIISWTKTFLFSNSQIKRAFQSSINVYFHVPGSHSEQFVVFESMYVKEKNAITTTCWWRSNPFCCYSTRYQIFEWKQKKKKARKRKFHLVPFAVGWNEWANNVNVQPFFQTLYEHQG